MKKVVFFLSVGFAGMDTHELHAYEDDVTDDDINADCYQAALDHADMYGYCEPYDYDEDEDEPEDISHGIEGSWEPYDPDKHNMHLVGYDDLIEPDKYDRMETQ